MILSNRINRTIAVISNIDSGAMDKQGRAIGFQLEIGAAKYVASENGNGYPVAPGYYFIVRKQATRNGKPYGPRQSDKLFTTAADQAAYIATVTR